MSDLIGLAASEVSGDPSCARALKILEAAKANGWTENNYCSFVLRLNHPNGLPLFARWDLAEGNNGKKSWRFAGARASNGQAMNLNDLAEVIEHPEFLFPEPPADSEEEEGNANDCTD